MSSRLPVDRAKVELPQPATAEQMEEEGNKLIADVTASTALANAPKVKDALADLTATNKDLADNNAAKAKAKKALADAETKEPPLVRRWSVRRRALAVAIEDSADGSKDAVAAFNVKVAEKKAPPEATVPTRLRPMKTQRDSTASVRWDPVDGARRYLLQHCTNPNDPATFSSPSTVDQTRYHLAGQTAGATVYFRVASVDKRLATGQTAFTAWVPVIAT